MTEVDRRRLAQLEQLERMANDLLRAATLLKGEIMALRAAEPGALDRDGETISSIPDWP